MTISKLKGPKSVAAAALVQIDSATVIDLVIGKKIRGSALKEDHDLAAWVVTQIEGKEQASHRFETLAKKYEADANVSKLYKDAAVFAQAQ